MKKYLLTLILIFQMGILSAQTPSELIIGTWRFDKECDLRTEKEKSEFTEIPWCPPETENGTGHADRIFKKNDEFEFYLTEKNSVYGLYKIKNGKLIIEKRISKEQAEQKADVIKRFLNKNLIEVKADGFYYYKPIELNLKSISNNQLELGSGKYYIVWKKVN